MTMAYRKGYCPCCGRDIMTKSPFGELSSFKPIFRQVDLHLEAGTKVRTIMCSKCFDNGFDKEALLATITHENSQACDRSIAEHIKSLGKIVDYRLAAGFQGTPVYKKNTPADTASLNQIHEV